MILEYGLNQLARVSFEKVGKMNPMVNMPVLDHKGVQVMEDKWESIDSITARALGELQLRIDALENALAVRDTSKRIEDALDAVAVRPMPPKKKKPK
jgi:hypothetical protein